MSLQQSWTVMQLVPKLTISDIDATHWPPDDNILSSYPFLSLLESSNAINAQSGWQPLYLCVYPDGDDHHSSKPLAVIPSYVKSHSYGEYVFDWAWANAYQQSGLEYYPKLLTATPLTPCIAPKWIGDLSKSEVLKLVGAISSWAKTQSFSSWHINFLPDCQDKVLSESDLLHRQDIQFHWQNKNYQSFDEFLVSLKAKKRRNIQQERNKVRKSGWTFENRTAKDMSVKDWELFYQLYCNTFDKKGGWAQLNQDFFLGLTEALPDKCVINFASFNGEIKAGALFLLSETHLYGRYWGTFEYSSALHFECCYYQGIELAIEKGLQVFEPGAQGEHKLARGFDPVITNSYHQVFDSQFYEPIAAWCKEEKKMVLLRYQQYLAHSAYK